MQATDIKIKFRLDSNTTSVDKSVSVSIFIIITELDDDNMKLSHTIKNSFDGLTVSLSVLNLNLLR